METTMKSKLALVGAILCAFGATGAQAALTPYVQKVEARMSSPEGLPRPLFTWDVSYQAIFDGASLVKHVEIDFLFLNVLGFTPAQKAAWKADTEVAIESIWNDKYRIVDTVNNRSYALSVDVTLEGYPQDGLPNAFDQAVTVLPQPGDCASRPNALDCRENMLNWFADSTDTIKAHEFGHMIGLYDEYVGGAVDKANNPTLSNDGLMGLGALSDTPAFYARYFQSYADFLAGVPLAEYRRLAGNGLSAGQFVLVPVPEPSTWAMLVVGSMMLGFGVRRARRA
jgi:hypothetical protein